MCLASRIAALGFQRVYERKSENVLEFRASKIPYIATLNAQINGLCQQQKQHGEKPTNLGSTHNKLSPHETQQQLNIHHLNTNQSKDKMQLNFT